MVYIAWFATVVLIGISLIAILNTLTFPRLGRYLHPLAESRAESQKLAPCLVSILIPARNEALRIGKTVQSILAQTYTRFELIILDDQSSDGTAEVVHAVAPNDCRLKVVAGLPLPEGWLGKNWACHQLARSAKGEILIFTDADVFWEPFALNALLNLFVKSKADLLTVWPTQHTVTWGERLVVPLMAFVVIGYLPLLAVHYLPWAVFAAANGQCMVFRRSAYLTVGGHAAVRKTVIEDITLSRRIKRFGLRLRMADGDGLISCRMYASWAEVCAGYAKNILAGHLGSVSFLLLSTLFHWIVFLFPWIWLMIDLLNPGKAAFEPAWSISLIVLGVGVRLLSAAVTHQRLADALLMPVSTLLMTRIALQSIWQHRRYGGVLWKGRVVSK